MLQFLLVFLMCALPGEGDSLLRAVPAGSEVVAAIHDIGAAREALVDSSWGRFLQDPEAVAFLEAAAGKLDLSSGRIEEELGDLSPLKLADSVTGELVVFLDMEEFGRGAGGVLLELGESRDAFDEYLAHFEEMLRDKGFEESAASYADLDLTIFEPESEGEGNLILADRGDAFVLVVHTDREAGLGLMQDILDTLADDSDRVGVDEEDVFQQARERAGGGGDAEIFINLTKAVPLWLAGAGLDPEALGFLGLEDLKSLYWRVDLGTGEEVGSVLWLGLEGDGLIRALIDSFGGERPAAFLSSVPADADACTAGFWDLNGMYTRILDAIEQQDEASYQMYRGTYDQMMKQQFGIDPEQEILAQLDGRFGGFSLPVPQEERAGAAALGMNAGIGNGGLSLVGVKDTDVFQANFEKTLRAFGLHVSMKKEEFQGYMIHSINLPVGGLKLYWTFAEKWFAFSFFPTAVRSYLRLLANEDLPTIERREDFAAFFREHAGCSWISAGDKARNMATMVAVVTQGLNAVGGPGDGGGAPLPVIGPGTIDKYFKGMIGTAVQVDDAGVRVEVSAH